MLPKLFREVREYEIRRSCPWEVPSFFVGRENSAPRRDAQTTVAVIFDEETSGGIMQRSMGFYNCAVHEV